MRRLARAQFSTGLYYAGMFGLWEIAQTSEALRQMNVQMAGAQDREELLQAQAQGISAATAGPLSSIAGLALDAVGLGPRSVGSLTSNEMQRVQSQNRFEDMRWQQTYAVRTMSAQLAGNYEAGREASRQQMDTEHREARKRISFIREQLGNRPASYWELVTTSDVGERLKVYQQGVPKIGDPGVRSALASEMEALKSGMTVSRDQATFREKELAKDIMYERSAIQASANASMDIVNRVPVRQSAINQMVGQQHLQLMQLARTAPNLVYEQALANNAQLQAMTTEMDQQSRVADMRTGAFVEGSFYRSQRAFYTARRREMIGTARADWEAADRDPAEQARISRRLGANLRELDAGERFERGERMGMVIGGTQSTLLRMQHDPLAATLKDLETEKRTVLNRIPTDDPALYQATERQYRVREAATRQQHRERRFVDSYSLETQVEFAGQMAEAVGVGANQRRMEAQMYATMRQAEGRAMTRLLADRTDMANANQERQLGINQLRGMRANYLEGMNAFEGSIFRTNLQDTSAGNPTEILKSIDTHIQQLTTNIGKTYNTVGP